MKRLLAIMVILMVAGCTPVDAAEQPKVTTCSPGYSMIAGKCVERPA